MAISQRNNSLIKLKALEQAKARKAIFQHANLKIQWDKQGKHIQGHKNFDPLTNKSIFEHPDPQKLVNEFCGKGIKVGNMQLGAPGYQENNQFWRTYRLYS